ncbi:MAG: helix-turn-helix transcriptional regulator [Alphaproteobacteria bacterium]|nr:helix-turn-helix transcriptional regulator [Alphaproteobacteria bacterium]
MIYSTKLLRALRADIGRDIHAERVRRRIVLGRLAKLSGVSEGKLDRYEFGRNEIRLDELLRIACALDVHVEALLTPG